MSETSLQAITDLVCGELQRLVDSVKGSPEMQRIFNLIVGEGTRGLTTLEIARRLGVPETSLNTRFCRPGLPSVRRLKTEARLCLVAHLLHHHHTVGEVAFWCGASTAQALGRHIRKERGVTARVFGAADPAAELGRFAALLHRHRWPTHPLTGGRIPSRSTHGGAA